MGIDFNGINSNQPGKTGSRSPAKNDAVQAKEDKSQPQVKTQDLKNQTSVHLSSDAKTLKRLEDAASKAPAVNQDRVAAIKKQISDGQYKVDARKIADKLVAHEDFLEKQFTPIESKNSF
ncbi:MAG: flagellar biosynthesis anti-sigma factor FlgM [Gammaproteobacteria bacterium]|nr:MAG: flagellar biosynthesis anti-sigma factor FlgM [Gammaproteobacteria bacterium]